MTFVSKSIQIEPHTLQQYIHMVAANFVKVLDSNIPHGSNWFLPSSDISAVQLSICSHCSISHNHYQCWGNCLLWCLLNWHFL